jgi:hypothetical protein
MKKLTINQADAWYDTYRNARSHMRVEYSSTGNVANKTLFVVDRLIFGDDPRGKSYGRIRIIESRYALRFDDEIHICESLDAKNSDSIYVFYEYYGAGVPKEEIFGIIDL